MPLVISHGAGSGAQNAVGTGVMGGMLTATLLAIVRDLQNHDIACIYISHKLNEVKAISDTICVIRDGQHIGTRDASGMSEDDIITMMVGRELTALYPSEPHAHGEEILRVEHLTAWHPVNRHIKRVNDVSFSLRRGEILGIAGLVGAGRSELAQLIFGVRKATAGVIEIDGEPVVIHSPREAIDLGIGFLTENRKEQGLFLELAAQENITMATLERDATWGMLNRRKAQTISDDAIQLLNIRVPHAQVRAGGLSGGNQQKLLISRWVAIGPRILILDEPTRGVDVGAKSEIYRIMNDMARQGVAILMISSELPEVVGMSDRVYVMREGAIAGELQAG
ncbi:ATP-binding cassette domain-containing protein, partial [Escherichia coli]|nr:ATP-binding cassette domain-containing protein [Escherichia coli]